jgi:16S rRNA (cytosine967-C5)-methyltransferase
LRWLGSAQAARARLAPKAPPPAVDALLLTALSLLWPGAGAPYAEHTLVDQAVAAARARVPANAGFINAVLRRFLRERDAIVATVQADPEAHYNHPRWWIERLQRDWPVHWPALLQANNLHPPMTLRVNARWGDADAYLSLLAEAGLAAHRLGSHALQLHVACPVDRLPGFRAGLVSVQDEAAQQAALLLLGRAPGLTLAPLPVGARVLDACAAPGGKTAHLLECADLDLLAIDSDAKRLLRVHDTLARLNLKAQTQAADAGTPALWWDGRAFDAILLDAPCSASGIVRRHPDVRWLRRSSDIDQLAATQDRLLEALWPLLAPGGRLLYCTCSVFKAEGQDRIDAFLQRHVDAELSPAPASPGHLLPLRDNGAQDALAGGVAAPADGFFYSLLLKRAD